MSSSSFTSFAASSSVRSLKASRTFTLRARVRSPPRLENMPCSCCDSSSMPGRRHDLDADRHGAQLDLDLAVVERALAQHLAKPLAGVAVAVRLGLGAESDGPRPRQQHVEHAFLGRVHGAVPDLLHLGLARHLDRDVHEVLDDRVHLAADVADLGELGRLDLDEGRASKPREPARDLGLAHAGRPDHQDVLRRDLRAQALVDLHAPPAVPERDGDRALGGALPDDVLVEFLDDLAGSHGGHQAGSVSMVTLRLV